MWLLDLFKALGRLTAEVNKMADLFGDANKRLESRVKQPSDKALPAPTNGRKVRA